MVEVLADGGAGRVEIRSSAGHDILDRAALEAVRTWKFEPGRREGRAVPVAKATGRKGRLPIRQLGARSLGAG